MVAALDVRLALGDLVRRDPRRREHLREVGAGQVLDGPRVRDLVHAAADEQVAGQRPRGRVLDHLVDLELVVPRARLEEEVVREVLDEVAGREDVVAVPWPAVRVLRQRALAAGDEVLRVADALDGRERRFAASTSTPLSLGEAPVSIVLIAVATSSMWPNSSAAMFATRS